MTWTALVAWWSNNPIARMVTYIFLFLIGWEVVKRHLKEAGREAERAAIAKKQAEVREAVIERKDEIISQERTSADTALEARDREYPATSFDELPIDEKRVLDRRFRSGETS